MNILVLGNFGFSTEKLDGQTIKTRNVYELVSKKNSSVSSFDTSYLKKNPFLFFVMLKKVIVSEKVIYLPAHGNLFFLFPIIFLLSKIFHSSIIYIIIGGWLTKFLENKHYLVYCLKHITIIYSETHLLKEELKQKYGIINTDVFPNFRINVSVKNNSLLRNFYSSKIKLVFMARIQMMKGLDTIYELCNKLVNKNESKYFELDFYGQIDSHDSDYFNSLISKFDFVHYCGCLEPSIITETLSSYDLLILPTHYYTEGFPGSILDAYIAGIPVIVTNWKYASEFVDDGETGYIVPFVDCIESIYNHLVELHRDRYKLQEMKIASVKKSKLYSEDTALQILSNYI